MAFIYILLVTDKSTRQKPDKSNASLSSFLGDTRLVGAQYATGDQWRNNYRNNEGMEPKQKQYPVVDVTNDRSKVRCCK